MSEPTPLSNTGSVTNTIINPEQTNQLKQGERLFRFDQALTCVKVSNGLAYFGASSGDVIVVQLADRRVVDRFQIFDGSQRLSLTCMDIYNDRIAFGCLDGSIAIYDQTTKQKYYVWKSHQQKVTAIKFIDVDHNNITWDFGEEKAKAGEDESSEHSQEAEPAPVANKKANEPPFTTNIQLYTTSLDGYFLVHDCKKAQVIHSFSVCSCPVSSMAVESPGLVYLGSWDGQIRKLDLNKREVELVITCNKNKESSVRALCLAPSLNTAKSKKKDPNADQRCFLVYCAHGVGEFKCWDMRSGLLTMDSCLAHADVINQMVLHHGKIYAAADDRTIRMLDARSGVCIETLQGHEHSVVAMDIHNEELVTCGLDRSARLYKIPSIEASITLRQQQLEETRRAAYEAFMAEKKAGKKKGKKSKKDKGGSKKGKKGKKGKADDGGADVQPPSDPASVAAAQATIDLSGTGVSTTSESGSAAVVQ